MNERLTSSRTSSAVLIGLLAAVLSACTPQSQDLVAREAAKGVVNSILASRFPGVPTAAVTDCVIDNATSGEIFTLASAAVTGVTPAAQTTTTTILKRPATVQCIATNGVSGILAGL